MSVIYIVLPLAIVMAGVALAAFSWAVRRGQFDDLDTPRYRALFEETTNRETHDLKPIIAPSPARDDLH